MLHRFLFQIEQQHVLSAKTNQTCQNEGRKRTQNEEKTHPETHVHKKSPWSKQLKQPTKKNTFHWYFYLLFLRASYRIPGDAHCGWRQTVFSECVCIYEDYSAVTHLFKGGKGNNEMLLLLLLLFYMYFSLLDKYGPNYTVVSLPSSLLLLLSVYSHSTLKTT